MSNYLLNTWYVAAWSHELQGEALLERTLLERPVLLYRTQGGEAVAIGGRCPHRFAPLGMGRRFGDVIACGYHGLRFDRSGACVHNPHGEGRIPPTARVPGYPLQERQGLLWIWMGEAVRADPGLIPDYAFLENPQFDVVDPDRLTLACHYELAADNLMDLSHAVFLHEGSFGTPDAVKGRLTVSQDADRVDANTWVADCTPAGAAFPVAGPGAKVDHWLDMEWRAPSKMVLRVGSTPCGQPREVGLQVIAPHLLTPETAATTHYFFASCVPAGLDRGPPDARPSQRDVFQHEDDPMLSAVQRMMGGADLWSLKPVLLPGDAGAVWARRVLAGLIAAEAREAATAAA